MVLKNLFTGQQWRNRHREQTYWHRERGGEVGKYGKSKMQTNITVCETDSQWWFAVWLRKFKQGLCINLEWWDGKGDGREVQKGAGICIRSVAQSCPTLCNPMNRSMPGLPVHHQLPEFIQIHVHRVSDAIQPSHPLSSPSPPAPNPSQHQSLFQWVNSSHEVAKVLEFQL